MSKRGNIGKGYDRSGLYFDLSDNDILTVTLCMHGRTFVGQAPLGELLDGVRAEIAAMHLQLHGDVAEALAASHNASADVVRSAGQYLVGCLMQGAAPQLLVGSFWDKVKSYAGDAYDYVKDKVEEHKGDIAAQAEQGAGQLAAAYGGPTAGAIAGSAAKKITLAVIPDPKKDPAQQAAEAAAIKASVPPDYHAIIDAAVHNSLGLYKAAALRDGAIAGVKGAQDALHNIATAAANGNADAAQDAANIAQVHAAAGDKPALPSKGIPTGAKIAAGAGALGLLVALLV